IISGPVVAASIRAELSEDIAALKKKGIQPGLAVVLVGADPASEVYVRSKRKTCEELGIASFSHDLPATCTERRLLGIIAKLNADPKVHGILVQMPLPKHIDEQRVLNAI